MTQDEDRSGVAANGIAWRQTGQGPPLLLINGYAATKDDWDPNFLGHLATESTVICPDNRGVGESARGDGELTIESMAADLSSLLAELDLKEVDIAGWSMGGFIAQTLAGEEPGRTRSLTLLATNPGGTLSKWSTREAWSQLIDKSGSPDEQARRLIDLIFPPDFAGQVYEAAGGIVAAAKAALDPAVLLEQEQAMSDWHQKGGMPLPKIIASSPDLPLLFAHGLEDVVIPPENSQIMSELARDAWYAPFSGGGHAFMAQEPERLGGLINTFLGRG